MQKLNAYRRDLLEQYAKQASDLQSVLAALGESELHRQLEPGGWSNHQLLVHLRDIEAQVFLPRLKRILEEEHPTLEDFDQEAWMAGHYDANEPAESIVEEFGSLRLGSPVLKADLPPSAWNRFAFHPDWGRRTFQWWVERAVQHTQEHLAQLAAG